MIFTRQITWKEWDKEKPKHGSYFTVYQHDSILLCAFIIKDKEVFRYNSTTFDSKVSINEFEKCYWIYLKDLEPIN